MSQITDITPQVKDKTRCNIYIDNRFACGLKLETVMSHRIKKGMAITPERLGEIQLESERSEALDKALGYIASSMRSEKEIRDYLKKKGYLADVEDFVVEKMKSYGYIDDEAYGKLYASSLSKTKGKRMVEMKLRQKGLSEEDARAAIGTIENEGETAGKILEKYMRHKECNRENLYKAFKYLMGKGFEFETAKAAIAKWGADDEDL